MSKKYISIAIDGPAGAGKTTVAKLLAKKIGYRYVDTGAFYRAIAFALSQMTPDYDGNYEKYINDSKYLDSLNIHAVWDDITGKQTMVVLGKEIQDEQLRTEEMSMLASNLSALPAARAFLLDMQRKVAKENNVVMEGRDIGSVVLPNAEIKVFLSANPLIRAYRRFKDLRKKNPDISEKEVFEALLLRDNNDTHRKEAPLTCVKGSIIIDSSEIAVDAVVDLICNALKEIHL